jgi:sulfur carrier protein
MEIKLNNQTQLINEGSTLHDIVFAQLGEKQKGVAVAINNTVIQKQFWNTTVINQNDSILIIKATQGG